VRLRAGIASGLLRFVILVVSARLFVPALFIEMRNLRSCERMEDPVERAGFRGPLVIAALMTVAVVIGPPARAAIALVAKTAYGRVRGTLPMVPGAAFRLPSASKGAMPCLIP